MFHFCTPLHVFMVTAVPKRCLWQQCTGKPNLTALRLHSLARICMKSGIFLRKVQSVWVATTCLLCTRSQIGKPHIFILCACCRNFPQCQKLFSMVFLRLNVITLQKGFWRMKNSKDTTLTKTFISHLQQRAFPSHQDNGLIGLGPGKCKLTDRTFRP